VAEEQRLQQQADGDGDDRPATEDQPHQSIEQQVHARWPDADMNQRRHEEDSRHDADARDLVFMNTVQ